MFLYQYNNESRMNYRKILNLKIILWFAFKHFLFNLIPRIFRINVGIIRKSRIFYLNLEAFTRILGTSKN